MARYAVNNTAPRPESYLTGSLSSRSPPFTLLTELSTDYLTAHDPTSTTLNDTQLADLYGELASGAETGILFSSLSYTDDETDVCL